MQLMEEIVIPIRIKVRSRKKSLDRFILVVLSWRLLNVYHSARLSILFRIGRNGWNDRLKPDNNPLGIIPDKG